MDIRRWQQVQLRKLLLQTLEKVPWYGKTHAEILGECRHLLEDLLGGLYDTTGTMASRFFRTITVTDPDTGDRVRWMWRDSQGRYWPWEIVRKNPVLLADCLKARQEAVEDDAGSHNRLAAVMEDTTGHPYPKLYIVRQLDLGLFDTNDASPEPSSPDVEG